MAWDFLEKTLVQQEEPGFSMNTAQRQALLKEQHALAGQTI